MVFSDICILGIPLWFNFFDSFFLITVDYSMRDRKEMIEALAVILHQSILF